MATAFSSLVSTHSTSRAVPVATGFSRCCRWLHRSGTICTKDLAAQLANTTHHSVTISFNYSCPDKHVRATESGSNDGDFQTKYLPAPFKTSPFSSAVA